MTISEKTIKLLWSNVAGRCSFSRCNKRLTVEQAAHSAPYTLGEMAHIKGKRKEANRYDSTQTEEQRDSYGNLILLCPNHHTEIDKSENEGIYTVEILTEIKITHERSISEALAPKTISDIEQLKDKIAILLAENHQSWLQYGPLSENARRNPQSFEIHAIWLSERLSTIVPNNRAIASLLNTHREMFKRSKQAEISKFLTHANSYEQWVSDEIPYQAILRFQTEFEELILEE